MITPENIRKAGFPDPPWPWLDKELLANGKTAYDSFFRLISGIVQLPQEGYAILKIAVSFDPETPEMIHVYPTE